MAKTKLTDKMIAALPAPTDAAQAYYWDDDVTGLCVVVGATGAKAFMVRGRCDGKRLKLTLGAYREPLTLADARVKALAQIVEWQKGVTTAAGKASGPTLRDGMTAHVARMRKKNRAARSIQTFEHELTKYLAAWLDRPIAELTGADLVDLQESIKRKAKAREGTNPRNDKGAPLANRVITHVSAAWNSLNRRLEGKLGTWNPAKAVDRDVLQPKRERLDTDAMPDWATRVETMRNPIQRDGLMLALYTGLRSEDVRTVRWEHVDLDEHTLRLPDPKGGEGAAFTIPLSATPLAILERRKAENARSPVLLSAGGDGGWAFPAVDLDGKPGPIGDLRQQVKHDDGTHSRFPVEDVHTLRRTWESIAHEEGISELDQHVLSNHSFGSHNVNATYISQHLDHLAACADKIDTGITRRLKGSTGDKRKTSKARRGSHLASV